MPAADKPRYVQKNVIDVLLDKISNMREDLLTVELALERIQAQALELENPRKGSGESA
jgi:hypothetical protein